MTVLQTVDSFALKMAKAALEEAAIPYLTAPEQQPGGLPGFHGAAGIGETPLWRCAVRVLVAEEDAEDARALLEPLANPAPLEGEDAG